MNLKNKEILLVSKHQKEIAIQAIFKQTFNSTLVVVNNVDTDVFGTFSGEIERKLSAKETVLQKCWAGLNWNPSFKFAIASEGSFGAHPSSVFLPYNEEWLVIVDRESELAIFAKSGTSDTNFFSEEITEIIRLEKILDALSTTYFNLKNIEGEIILKGCKDIFKLKKEALKQIKIKGKVTLETDLRAMHNPLRMKNIEKAAQNLVEKLISTCPKCNHVGFSVEKSIAGLPCEICSFPSTYPKQHIKVCPNCQFEEIIAPLHRQKYLEAQYCQLCNP